MQTSRARCEDNLKGLLMLVFSMSSINLTHRREIDKIKTHLDRHQPLAPHYVTALEQAMVVVNKRKEKIAHGVAHDLCTRSSLGNPNYDLLSEDNEYVYLALTCRWHILEQAENTIEKVLESDENTHTEDVTTMARLYTRSKKRRDVHNQKMARLESFIDNMNDMDAYDRMYVHTMLDGPVKGREAYNEWIQLQKLQQRAGTMERTLSLFTTIKGL
jgi:hypothetical protein